MPEEIPFDLAQDKLASGPWIQNMFAVQTNIKQDKTKYRTTN